MSSILISLGKAIQKIRVRQGISQNFLARSLSNNGYVEQGYVSKIENGKKGMSIERLFLIASILGVKPSEIILTAEIIENPPKEPDDEHDRKS